MGPREVDAFCLVVNIVKMQPLLKIGSSANSRIKNSINIVEKTKNNCLIKKLFPGSKIHIHLD